MYICGRLSEVEEGAGSPLLLFLTDMCMIEKKVVSQLIEEKLASSSNYLVDVVIKPGNLIVVEIDNDEAVGMMSVTRQREVRLLLLHSLMTLVSVLRRLITLLLTCLLEIPSVLLMTKLLPQLT